MIKYLIPIAAVLVLSCSEKQDNADDSHNHDHPSVDGSQIELGELSYRSIHNAIECTGRVDAPPQNRASVHAPIEGIVYRTDILPGEKVAKGRVLAELRHPSIIKAQENYLNARAEWNKVKADFDRKQTLFQQNSLSEKEFQQLKSELDKAVASYQSSRSVLEYLGLNPETIANDGVQIGISIKAPIAGTITSNSVNIGKYVSADQEMFSITGTEHSHLELEVYARYLSELKKGQRITANFDGGKTIEGEVFLVSGAIEAESNTIHVHGHIDDERNSPPPGTYLRAVIYTESDTLPVLPVSAISESEAGEVVYVFDGENYHELSVQIGLRGNDYVEVINASDFEGLRVVTKGAYYVKYGVFEKTDAGHNH